MPSSSFICSMDNEVSPLKNEADSKACSRHLKSLLQNSEILLVSQQSALSPCLPWLGHILPSFKGSCSESRLCPQNHQLWLWGKRFPLSTRVLSPNDKKSYNLDFKGDLCIYLLASFIKIQDAHRSRNLPLFGLHRSGPSETTMKAPQALPLEKQNTISQLFTVPVPRDLQTCY